LGRGLTLQSRDGRSRTSRCGGAKTLRVLVALGERRRRARASMAFEEKQRVRVLYMIAEYDRISGGQQSLLQLVRGLHEEGFDPVVCFPGEGRCSEAYRRAGVNVTI